MIEPAFAIKTFAFSIYCFLASGTEVGQTEVWPKTERFKKATARLKFAFNECGLRSLYARGEEIIF